MQRYVLTPEGTQYMKNGLPEEQLVKMLDRPATIDECRSRLDSFNIALMWAKKKGFVKLDSGRLALVKKPGAFPEREALEKIHSGQGVSEDMVNTLLERRLIKKADDIFRQAERQLGGEIAALTPELIKTGLWKKARLRSYNVEAAGKAANPGKRQPYNRFLQSVRQRLSGLGFIEMTGPSIELEFWNFDALFQPQNHPSRDWTQTYSLKSPTHGALPEKGIVARVQAAHENGWETGSKGWGYRWDPKKAGRLMPRAHDTAISPRYMSRGIEIPGKYFSIVRCYRPDVIDATHGVEFNQLGGFVAAEGLTFRDILGLLRMFVMEFAGTDEVQFIPDYYPFVEPGVQVSVKHHELGWIELAGAGMFRPELTEPIGIKVPVIAWGFGIDRLAMYKLGINDIRSLFSQNLKWLREQRITVM
ncbi:MAG: phenylalanine--tRNA ligase subunit alpha [Candidatus Aenigmarchaeota archaeon]|nr:phenylalanine--tRNA ligase subunit alpha [Candidatus Aenigmarchaeota archaeon]